MTQEIRSCQLQEYEQTGKGPVSAGKPTGSAGRPVSAGRPSGSAARTPILAGRILGKLPSNIPSERFPRAFSVENSDIHDGLKIFDCLKSGIFTSSSYDEEFSGPDANNLASSVDVSSTITKRIHNIHPTYQVIGDINSLVHTRSQSEFEMSSMGPLTFFLRLHVDQRPDGIFIHQEKYLADILKKFDLDNSKRTSTPFEPQKIREKNVPDEPISVHLYRSMIGCLMYLTATRPDIMFIVCTAARHQVTPKTSNLLSVKRIFKFLIAYPKLGLWYPRDSLFNMEAFSDSDYAVATSSCEAEYVDAASCCGQWFLFTSAGRVTFCWLFPIPAGDLVSAGHILFLLGSASEVSLPDGVKGLVATIDGTAYTVTEA
nr:hypothetical protein [Tanacetum cinerariifolium]